GHRRASPSEAKTYSFWSIRIRISPKTGCRASAESGLVAKSQSWQRSPRTRTNASPDGYGTSPRRRRRDSAARQGAGPHVEHTIVEVRFARLGLAAVARPVGGP